MEDESNESQTEIVQKFDDIFSDSDNEANEGKVESVSEHNFSQVDSEDDDIIAEAITLKTIPEFANNNDKVILSNLGSIFQVPIVLQN